MPKPVLAVDFDDVLAGFNLAFAKWHNEHYGTIVEYANIYSYDMALIYDTDANTIRHRVTDFSHNYHDLIEPLDDAAPHLRLLKERYGLVLVTSRCESTKDITGQWKDLHIPEMFVGAYYGNSFSIRFPDRQRSKLDICREIGAVAHVDDAISHANEVASGLGIPVFLPNRPWNQEPIHEKVIRVSDWEEITFHLLA